jgi:hypothetical protein
MSDTTAHDPVIEWEGDGWRWYCSPPCRASGVGFETDEEADRTVEQHLRNVRLAALRGPTMATDTAAIVCKSTRYGVGCGHPTTDHTGKGECCCCNRKHNDPVHVDGCFRCHVRRVKRDLGVPWDGFVSCGEVAPLLPEPLRAALWQDAINRYFRRLAGLESADA